MMEMGLRVEKREPYGELNPHKTEYLAKLIEEVNDRLKNPREDPLENLNDDDLRELLGLPPLKL